ncbi:MAG: Crp/Fnr family transcriptional regulator [Candidatus Eisenbacteria bacterium]
MQRAVPFIESLSREGRALFDRQVLRRKFDRGTPILHRGDPVSGAYVVLRGRLRVFSTAPSGSEATLYTVAPGETCVFALNCLFQELTYPAWVEAEVQTEVAVMPGALFRHLFEAEPAVRDLTVRALSTAVFQLLSELEQVHFQQLDQRLAHLLLTRVGADGVVRMTQQTIAFSLGSSRETVARLLGHLTAEGIVETKRGAVRLLRPDVLSRYLESE